MYTTTPRSALERGRRSDTSRPRCGTRRAERRPDAQLAATVIGARQLRRRRRRSAGFARDDLIVLDRQRDVHGREYPQDPVGRCGRQPSLVLVTGDHVSYAPGPVRNAHRSAAGVQVVDAGRRRPRATNYTLDAEHGDDHRGGTRIRLGQRRSSTCYVTDYRLPAHLPAGAQRLAPTWTRRTAAGPARTSCSGTYTFTMWATQQPDVLDAVGRDQQRTARARPMPRSTSSSDSRRPSTDPYELIDSAEGCYRCHDGPAVPRDEPPRLDLAASRATGPRPPADRPRYVAGQRA